jgi:excisionase family DNA binding protein
MSERVLSIAEAATRLRVCDKTIRRLISSGALAAGKVGGIWRIKQSDADALLPGDGAPARQATPEIKILLTIDETAWALSVSTRTVRRLVSAGEIPTVRIGRQVLFRLDALHDWARELGSAARTAKGGKPRKRK